MAEITPGLTLEQVQALIAQQASTSYVGGSNVTPLTVASLHSTYPPSASYLGQYARVSDLYGAVDDIMRCRYDGVAYKWIPQRPNFNSSLNLTGGSMTITPLVTPPTIRLTGTLVGNVQIATTSANAYIGMQQAVTQNSALGLFTTTLTGLIGSNVTLLGGSTSVLEYGATGWFVRS